MRRLIQIFLCFVVALLWQGAAAQNDDVAANLKKVTPDEALTLRAILAEPLPQNALKTTLNERLEKKRMAAQRLGDIALTVDLYRQWEAVSPETLNWNNYAIALDVAGRYDESLAMYKLAVDQARPGIDKEFFRTNYAGALIKGGRFAAAKEAIQQTKDALAEVNSNRLTGYRLVTWHRILSQNSGQESRLQLLFGDYEKAIESALSSNSEARQAFDIATTLPVAGNDTVTRTNSVSAFSATLISSWISVIAAYTEAGRFADAEIAMRNALTVSRNVDIQARQYDSLYRQYAALRNAVREFKSAEFYLRKQDALSESLGHDRTDVQRRNIGSFLIETLEGQHRWADALAELARWDDLANSDPDLRSKVRFNLVRGFAYLHTSDKLAQAVQLFKDLGDGEAKRYPARHFFVAQARGLQGVAMWLSGGAENRVRALNLLRASVFDYMLPDNLDLETLGLRKDIRDLVFATYLEAVFQTPGANTSEALTAADWVRGGMVQQALADAAVRSSTADPVMGALVRQDQDARNEIEALRKYLARDGGNANTDTPEIATKMRARIDELEAGRHKLHAEIKSKFSDYDSLVRPTPPTIEDLQHGLAPDEALLMLLPAEDAVYVWALNSEGKNQAIRVSVSEKELGATVTALRDTLDFGAMRGYLKTFNAAVSSNLYQKLFKPVEESFAGKTHLIVAAGGVLGRFPVGVLLTSPVQKLDENSPWLIKRAAITHIPSLSAWLAVKRFAKATSAPEALDAWGDPQFDTRVQAASAAQAGVVAARNVSITRALAPGDPEKEGPLSAFKYSDIPALPETRDELLAIANILQANVNNDLHLGAQASKASVLQSSKSGELVKKKVVAFATHGLMAGDLPHLTQPALALAGTGNEDKDPLAALLTLDEVLNLKLNADWVILSACNTAAADGKADEALSGLARGFFYAGSRSLLVTHWAVESESAKELTTNTMKNYMANPTQRKAESLRQAMITVMAEPKYQHPAYWAPYALVGDGGR